MTFIHLFYIYISWLQVAALVPALFLWYFYKDWSIRLIGSEVLPSVFFSGVRSTIFQMLASSLWASVGPTATKTLVRETFIEHKLNWKLQERVFRAARISTGFKGFLKLWKTITVSKSKGKAHSPASLALQDSRWQVTWTEEEEVTCSSARLIRWDFQPKTVKRRVQILFPVSEFVALKCPNEPAEGAHDAQGYRRSDLCLGLNKTKNYCVNLWDAIAHEWSGFPSGLRAGDEVLAVNGAAVSGLDLDLMHSLFRHQELQLLLRREESPDHEEPAGTWPEHADPSDPSCQPLPPPNLHTWTTGTAEIVRLFRQVSHLFQIPKIKCIFGHLITFIYMLLKLFERKLSNHQTLFVGIQVQRAPLLMFSIQFCVI